MEALGCLINPGPCLSGVADGILSIFPFGLYGIVFLGGMIVGERIGIWGIVIAIAGWIALRFGTKTRDSHEQLKPGSPDAAPPVPKPKKPRKTPF